MDLKKLGMNETQAYFYERYIAFYEKGNGKMHPASKLKLRLAVRKMSDDDISRVCDRMVELAEHPPEDIDAALAEVKKL